MKKPLEYWKQNAEENYLTTPISVLRYISELENLNPIKLKVVPKGQLFSFIFPLFFCFPNFIMPSRTPPRIIKSPILNQKNFLYPPHLHALLSGGFLFLAINNHTK